MALLSSLKKKSGSDGVNVNTEVSSDVSVDKAGAQDSGRVGKVIAKKGSIVNLNIVSITGQNIPDDKKQLEEFKKELLESFKLGEIQLVEEQASKDIAGYNDAVKKSESTEVIEYLEGKVPPEDILYMRTGLYVKKLIEEGDGQNAKRIRDNACRNSQRARNIINLVSAGFLDEYILPIYQANYDDAVERYNEIVEQMPSLVFVSQGMSAKKALAIVENKIRNKEQYHWEVKMISVNGLNTCIRTINKMKDEIEKKYPNFELEMMQRDVHGISRGELRIILEKND